MPADVNFEASEMGLAPGEWPDMFDSHEKIDGCVTLYKIAPIAGTVRFLGYTYRTATGKIVKVWND